MRLSMPITHLLYTGKESEEALIRAARRGERSAFDRLRAMYDENVRAFVLMQAGQAGSEDIVQDAWLAAWKGINRFDGRARFKTWLFSIAMHKCQDYLRTQRRQARLNDASELSEESSAIEPAYHAIDVRISLRAAVQKLPEEQREVICMYYYHELTLGEIARLLERNLSTVKYQFYKAHQRVEQELDTDALAVTGRQSHV